MNYPMKNMIYLKQVYTFQPNQIKFENPKSSLPLKRFIIRSLTTLRLTRKETTLTTKEAKNKIESHLSYLADSYFYNCKPSPRILRQHRVL